MWMIHQSLESFAAGYHTMGTFYKKVVWSFNALYEGEVPRKDWMGKATGLGKRILLCGGRRFNVWGLTHDLEHGTKHLDQPNPTSLSPCGLCRCDSKDKPWFDFRPGAAYSLHIYNLLASLSNLCI